MADRASLQVAFGLLPCTVPDWPAKGAGMGGLLVALLFLGPGCGSVGEPRPPLLNIPERAGNFSARQRQDKILLSWIWPRRTTEGMRLKDLALFEVRGVAIADPTQPPTPGEFENRSELLATVRSANLGALGPGDAVDWSLPAAPLKGRTYALAIRSESSRGRSVGFSNLAVIEVIEPPARPQPPALTLEPQALVVRWPAVAGAQSYQVLRRGPGDENYGAIGVSEDAEFRDAGFQWNQPYAYRVIGIAASMTGTVPGAVSDASEIFAKDTFAPAPPQGLRAVPTEGSIELSWGPNQEEDLSGYRLQRGAADGSVRVLHDALLVTAGYRDDSIESGQTYRYLVTAVDRYSNESEVSEAVSVTAP